MRKRIAGLVSLLALTGGYGVIRYPLFALHGMKDWPLVLFIAGVLIIALSGLLKGDKSVPVFTALGYIVGFVLGYIFQFDYGREQNSMWIIWTGCYAAAILAGVCVMIWNRRRGHEAL